MRGISGLLVTFLAGALSGHASAQTLPGGAGVTGHAVEQSGVLANRPASWIEGRGRPITIKGERVCLKHREQGGPQTLECAMGFRGDDEKFYGLHDTSPYYWRTIGRPGGVRFQITGTLWPSSAPDRYVDVEGIIEVREAKRIDDPKALVGEYVCLPEVAQPSKPSDCAPGIKTPGGFYWAFYPLTAELRARLSELAVGDRLAVEGAVVGSAREEDWSRLWRTHPDIEAALQVMSLNVDAPKRGS